MDVREKEQQAFERMTEDINDDREFIEKEKSVFAEGLPEWNIEPPQVVKRKKI